MIEPGSYPNTGFRSTGDFFMEAAAGLGSVTLDGRGAATIEVTGQVVLQGLIVRNWSDEGTAVELDEGSVIADQCEFVSRSNIAVRTSKGGRLYLRNCKVDEGAVVYSASTGALENTVLTGATGNAVAIRSGSSVMLRSCRVEDAAQHAIWATEGSRPVLEQCTISGPGKSGIVVDDHASATIRTSTIQNAGETALVVRDKGKADAEDTRISDAGIDGVWVLNGAVLTARRVRVDASKPGRADRDQERGDPPGLRGRRSRRQRRVRHREGEGHARPGPGRRGGQGRLRAGRRGRRHTGG